MYIYNDKSYRSEKELQEAIRNDYYEKQKKIDEAEIRKLTKKNLIWSYRKNVVWVVIALAPIVILGVIKLIEIIISFFKS